MKNKNLLLMAFLIATQLMTAQTADIKVAFGVSVIKNEYNGDYGNGIFNFKQQMYPSGGLSVGYYLNPSFNAGIRTSFGDLGFKETIDNSFRGRKFDASLYAQYKLNNGYILNEDSKLSPFLTVGVGLAAYGINSSIDKSGSDPTLYPTIITKGADFIVPVGAGLKFQISERVAIQYQYLYNFTSSDIRDENRGVNFFGSSRHPASKSGNDAYGQQVVSIVFNIGKHTDTDKDGVGDKWDKCPGTPRNVKVDAQGCPVDTDGDGVADYLDKCPDTPAGVKVDAQGCPVDTDGDGIPDYLDKCPDVAAKGTKDGCPETVATLFHNIEFEFASDKLTRSSYPTLDQIAITLIANPSSVKMSVAGYTDYIGSNEYNLKLSVRRANSVRIYLLKKHVPAKSITIIGYGEENPIAPNETPEGRQKNRRVEFQITK